MKLNLIIFFGTLCLSSHIFAHPHVFINAIPTTSIENKQLVLKYRWSLDGFTSHSLVSSFDTNKDSVFDEKETLELKKIINETMAKESFYTSIIINGKQNKTKLKLTEFKVSIKDKPFRSVVYHLVLSSKNIIKELSSNDITITTIDRTNYIAFSSEKVVKSSNKFKLSDIIIKKYPLSFSFKIERIKKVK